MIKDTSKILSLSKLNKEDFNTLKKWREEEYKEIRSDLELILEGQKINQKDLQLGFIGLATQNNELIELNKKLNQQLERVEKELNVLKKERKEKAARKEARANRKRLPKRQPITREIYRLLMQASKSPSYTSVRLRIAFCLLTVTGIRINELLPLKVGQLQTLLESHWIGIDRSK
jgi:integrase